MHVSLEPALQLAQISKVSLPCALAFAVCPELRVEALDGYREFHVFTSLRADSHAASMNASFQDTVKLIMRRVYLFSHLSGRLPSVFAHVAATQALCAPISLEVSIDA
jgi:hypothetical protein